MTPQPLGPIEYEPITLAEAQLHLKLDTIGSPPAHPDDALVESLIVAVREHAENYTGRAFARQAYRLSLDAFPSDGVIDLGTWPVLEVESVTYIDTSGATQTVDPSKYSYINSRRPSSVVALFGEQWPATRNQKAAVTINFVAGCNDDVSPHSYTMPKSAKAAMLLMLGHLYENREAIAKDDQAELPLGVMALLTQHRINMGMR